MSNTVNFFVYGTLRPGEMRWGSLEPYALSVTAAYTYAKMYDTGYWPFIVPVNEPGPDSPQVVGEIVTVAAEDVPHVTRILDRIEGYSANDPTNSLFLRVVLPVHLSDGVTDIANMYIGGRSLSASLEHVDHIVSGDWKKRHSNGG